VATPKTDEFANRFTGRTDAWGGDNGLAIWEPVSSRLIVGHLDGTQGIGIYPIRERASVDDLLVVKWGCCDIDTGDWSEAYQLGFALEKMGLEPWIERSRSKGWHIWVFANEWVPAWVMRRALKVGYAAIGLRAKEANPKSERLRPEQLGNYVRLPYKGGLHELVERQTFMKGFDRHHDGVPMGFDEFIETPVGVETSVLEHWADKFFEPPRKHHVSVETLLNDEQISLLADRMKPQTRKVWENGPQKADRSATLQALGHAFAAQGFTIQECFQLVSAADRMWGKYFDRVNGEGYIVDIVERCYI
jgi:hypothetical protein